MKIKKPVTGNKIQKSIRVSPQILEVVEKEFGSLQNYINDVFENEICITKKDFLSTWAMREAFYPMIDAIQQLSLKEGERFERIV